MNEAIQLTREGPVALLTLNRPAALNSMGLDDVKTMLARLRGLADDSSVRALVITGAGRGFCAGWQLDGEAGVPGLPDESLGVRQSHLMAEYFNPLIETLHELPIPSVAAVNGVAAGAGAVIALASDFRVLARSASFAFLFTKVGLAGADMGAAYLLPRLVGFGRATELLILGDSVDAEEAQRIGLAGQVVDDADLPAAAQALARRLAEGPTLAHAATKSLLTRELDMGLSASVELEAWTQALLMKTADHAEFHAAFTDKRPPRWTGR